MGRTFVMLNFVHKIKNSQAHGSKDRGPTVYIYIYIINYLHIFAYTYLRIYLLKYYNIIINRSSYIIVLVYIKTTTLKIQI